MTVSIAWCMLAASFSAEQRWVQVITELGLPQDVEFIYEGGWTRLGDNEQRRYSCKGVYHRSGVLRMEEDNLSKDTRRFVSYRMGGDARETSGPRNTFFERKLNFPDLGLQPWYTVFWVTPQLQVIPAVEKHFHHEGTDTIDGHECEVFGLAFGETVETWGWRLWIDLERGGNALRIDRYFQEKLHSRIYDIVLKSFDGGDGKTYWLPVKSKYESYFNFGSKEEPSDGTPIVTGSYAILVDSVKLNQGLTADQAELQPLATNITPPKNRPMIPGPTAEVSAPSISPEAVEETIELAKAQEAELLEKAKKVSNQRTDWMSIGAFALALIGLCCLAFVGFQHIKQRRG